MSYIWKKWGLFLSRRWWSHGGWDEDSVRHYRRWWHLEEAFRHHPDKATPTLVQFAITALFLQRACSLACTFAVEDDVENTYTLHLALPFLFSVWFTWDVSGTSRPKRWVGEYGNGTWGLTANGSYVQLMWCYDNMDSSRNTRGRGDWLFMWDRFKGKHTVTYEVTQTQEVVLDQPAFRDSYPASHHRMVFTHQIRRDRWSNPLVSNRTSTHWDIKALNTPPAFEGKRGPDGIWGCACSGDLTLSQAIAWYIGEVIQLRERHG